MANHAKCHWKDHPSWVPAFELIRKEDLHNQNVYGHCFHTHSCQSVGNLPCGWIWKVLQGLSRLGYPSFDAVCYWNEWNWNCRLVIGAELFTFGPRAVNLIYFKWLQNIMISPYSLSLTFHSKKSKDSSVAKMIDISLNQRHHFHYIILCSTSPHSFL